MVSKHVSETHHNINNWIFDNDTKSIHFVVLTLCIYIYGIFSLSISLIRKQSFELLTKLFVTWAIG